jgi:hypothetical protein
MCIYTEWERENVVRTHNFGLNCKSQNFSELYYIMGSDGSQIQSLRKSVEEQSDHRRTSILRKSNSCSLHRERGSYFHFLLAWVFMDSVAWA